MAFYKYFKRSKLSEVLKNDDSLTIKEKETVAEELRKSEDSNRKRQKMKWTHVQRAEIGKHTTRHGNASTVRLLRGKYPCLKRETVSDFKLA